MLLKKCLETGLSEAYCSMEAEVCREWGWLFKYSMQIKEKSCKCSCSTKLKTFRTLPTAQQLGSANSFARRLQLLLPSLYRIESTHTKDAELYRWDFPGFAILPRVFCFPMKILHVHLSSSKAPFDELSFPLLFCAALRGIFLPSLLPSWPTCFKSFS